MEMIDMDDFDPEKHKGTITVLDEEQKMFVPFTSDEVSTVIKRLEDPLNLQKELAAKVHLFLNRQIDIETQSLGKLSDTTRKWITEYNDMLDKIQHAQFGEKTLHVHVQKISHSTIAQLMRQYDKEVVVDAK